MIGPSVILEFKTKCNDDLAKITLNNLLYESEWENMKYEIPRLVKCCRKEGFGLVVIGDINDQIPDGRAYRFMDEWQKNFKNG